MMEIKTSEIQDLAPVIITNYDELKKELTEKTDLYKNMVYSEATIKDAKTDRANLNKLEKAINDEKIRVKNLFLKPFEDFETKCKELMALVKDASTNIDTQVKTFEAKQDEEKKELIENRYEQLIGKYKDFISLDKIWNPRWLNKTYTFQKIEEDIVHVVTKTNTDFATLEAEIKDKDILTQVKDFYFQNIDKAEVLSLAINEKNRIIESQQQIKNMENETVEQEQNLITIEFRVHATPEQLNELKKFLLINNIKIERI